MRKTQAPEISQHGRWSRQQGGCVPCWPAPCIQAASLSGTCGVSECWRGHVGAQSVRRCFSIASSDLKGLNGLGVRESRLRGAIVSVRGDKPEHDHWHERREHHELHKVHSQRPTDASERPLPGNGAARLGDPRPRGDPCDKSTRNGDDEAKHSEANSMPASKALDRRQQQRPSKLSPQSVP